MIFVKFLDITCIICFVVIRILSMFLFTIVFIIIDSRLFDTFNDIWGWGN